MWYLFRMRLTVPVIVLLILLSSLPALALDVTVRVSSMKMDVFLPYAPEHLLDGDLNTAWAGGGLGAGEGQWIELQFDYPVRLDKLGIFNGHHGEGKFEEFRRIRSGRLVYPDGSSSRFWLHDEKGEQIIECDGRSAKSIRIVVDGVFPEGEWAAKKKLAVAEIKLYVALMADPAEMNASEHPATVNIPTPAPQSPSARVPDEMIELLRSFYVRQTTMADDFAELFAHDVRDKNDFRQEVFKSIQMQRGTYKILRNAEVETEGLGFELVDMQGVYARVRVFGAYRVNLPGKHAYLEEDSIFVLSKESEGWRILELEGEESFY